MIGLAFWIDIRAHKTADYAFWVYIFGVLAFWGGLSSQHSDDELSKFIYFCINLGMIAVGVLLVRRVFVVFGALGSCLYVSHLASVVFKDSWLFPIALTAIGLGVIYLGVLWQKHEQAVTQATRQFLPQPLRELLDGKVISMLAAEIRSTSRDRPDETSPSSRFSARMFHALAGHQSWQRLCSLRLSARPA